MQLRQHKLLIYLLFFLGALFTFHISSADDLDSSPFQPEKYPEIMKECALDNILIGVPPESGTRYWETPFRPINKSGCYVSILKAPAGHIELWSCKKRSMGPGLESLGDWENMFENDLINDVYDMNEKEKLAAGRAFERADIYHDTKEGYVLFGCVCPSYGWPAPLLPAIMVSKTGEKGTWKYLGKLKGEPALEYAKGKTWSDGGSIVRSTDGKWRAYLNGFGTVLAAIECDTLDGEWRFLRNANGEIREILPDFPKDKGHGGCFPQVLKIDEKDWHCWISDKWPPQSIFHFQSDDGLNWKPFGKQPEITRKAFNGMPIKCLRCFYDSKSKKIIGLLSIWGKLPQAELKSTRNNTDQWWCLYMSTMPPVPACP